MSMLCTFRSLPWWPCLLLCIFLNLTQQIFCYCWLLHTVYNSCCFDNIMWCIQINQNKKVSFCASHQICHWCTHFSNSTSDLKRTGHGICLKFYLCNVLVMLNQYRLITLQTKVSKNKYWCLNMIDACLT